MKRKRLVAAWHLLLSEFLKWEVNSSGWVGTADLSAQQSWSAQLWRPVLFHSRASHCGWDQSTAVKLFFDGGAHTGNSPAHSGCCCPAGLCSAPAVTSNLGLCCKWCASSPGYPSFCWPGTSLLFLLPRKLCKESIHSNQGWAEKYTALYSFCKE